MNKRIAQIALVPLLLSACVGKDARLVVRPVATGFAEGERPASFRIAEARAHFALGNVALAAEGFRRALREDPRSVDALNGLAACYDRMGRFDLARSHYEQALALAPDDARLYANLVTSLELQGQSAEAEEVRKEASARFAMAARAIPLSPPSEAEERPQPSISLALADTPTAEAVAATPETRPAAPSVKPRLERVGLGEIALRSGTGPSWASLRPAPIQAARRTTRVPASQSAQAILLLNGTSQTGVAGRTRAHLMSSGWRAVTIGLTAEPLRSSQILYAPARAQEARRLSKELGIPLRQRDWSNARLVVQLGRDRLQRRSPA